MEARQFRRVIILSWCCGAQNLGGCRPHILLSWCSTREILHIRCGTRSCVKVPEMEFRGQLSLIISSSRYVIWVGVKNSQNASCVVVWPLKSPRLNQCITHHRGTKSSRDQGDCHIKQVRLICRVTCTLNELNSLCVFCHLVDEPHSSTAFNDVIRKTG